MNAKILVFGICVEGTIYLLIYSLYDCRFKYSREFLIVFIYCWTPATVEMSYEFGSLHSSVRKARSQGRPVSFSDLLHEAWNYNTSNNDMPQNPLLYARLSLEVAYW